MNLEEMEDVKLKVRVSGYAPMSVNTDAFDIKPSGVDWTNGDQLKEWNVTISFDKKPKRLCDAIIYCEIPYEVNALCLPDSVEEIITSLDWLSIDNIANLSINKSLLSADEKLIICGAKIMRQIGEDSEVVIPEGTKVIGEGAFLNKKNLAKIEFPKTIEEIERKAFSGCTLLPVKLPRNVKKIGDYAFERCGSAMDKASRLTITSKVTHIGNYSFKGCNMITGVKVPNSVIAMGQGVFAGADRIKIFEGNGASSNGLMLIWNKRLVSYALDASVLMHDTITLPSDIEEIGDWAITYDKPERHWRYIREIPENIKRIGTHSLFACGMGSSLTIPNSVEEIGEGAFSDAINVNGKFVDGEGNVIVNGTLIFNNGLGKKSDYYATKAKEYPEFKVPEGVNRIGCFANIHAENLILPEGVESIGENALYASKHISIPSTLKYVEDNGIRCGKLCEEPSFPESLLSIGSTLDGIDSYSVRFTSNPPICRSKFSGRSLIVVPENKFEMYREAFDGVISGDFLFGQIAYRDENGELHFKKQNSNQKVFWSEFEDLAPANEAFNSLLKNYQHGVTKENGEIIYTINILPDYLRIELRCNPSKGLCACTLHELQKVEKYEGLHFFAFNEATGYTRSFNGIDRMVEKSSNCIYLKEKSGFRNEGIVWKIPADTDSMEIYALLYAAANIQAEKILPLLTPKDE
ncbi:leucine-rich repeat domain-containing protein [uncultured Duncaniella sp.]|uniref:leucine-rich repeat domain-containing protein n=2 Tax=uncultured Duncaniella sp. TaxID=2768039 RepID=UPI002634A9AB|nr:leucine-rich repeat domain-containing protein [uncultured Duncaniella sp.]